MQIATTTLSSKGQIIIPAPMRTNFQEGEQFLVVQTDESIILKKASSLDESLKEDLEFERRTREALKEIDEGKGIKVDLKDLEKVMDSW